LKDFALSAFLTLSIGTDRLLIGSLIHFLPANICAGIKKENTECFLAMGVRAGEHQRSLSFGGATSSSSITTANNMSRSAANNGNGNSNHSNAASANSRSRQVNYIPSSPSPSQPASPSTSSNYGSPAVSRRLNTNRSREDLNAGIILTD
jgi:hypothetical protein